MSTAMFRRLNSMYILAWLVMCEWDFIQEFFSDYAFRSSTRLKQ